MTVFWKLPVVYQPWLNGSSLLLVRRLIVLPPSILTFIGANSGIGFATTRVIAHASENFHVIMAGRSHDKVNNAKSTMEREGINDRLSTVQLDVTDEDSIMRAAAFVQGQFGRLDVLVNNAGVASLDTNLKTRLEHCLTTNVVGPALVSEAFRPLLLRSSNPYSIYVSSGVGSLTMTSDPASIYRNLPKIESYRASKAAVNMIMLQEAIETTSSTPLKVFALCPGFVKSNLGGTSEVARNVRAKAGDPMVSGETILGVIQGRRDEEAGRVIHKDGVYPW